MRLIDRYAPNSTWREQVIRGVNIGITQYAHHLYFVICSDNDGRLVSKVGQSKSIPWRILFHEKSFYKYGIDKLDYFFLLSSDNPNVVSFVENFFKMELKSWRLKREIGKHPTEWFDTLPCSTSRKRFLMNVFYLFAQVTDDLISNDVDFVCYPYIDTLDGFEIVIDMNSVMRGIDID